VECRNQHAWHQLNRLVGIFYDPTDELAQFHEVTADELPDTYRRLLAHDEHMTVTVEAWHQAPVELKVLASKHTAPHYARKIVLVRQYDGVVVQFGIVRMNFNYLSEGIRREVEFRLAPLGRILIQHNVMRKVDLAALWRVTPGRELSKLFGSDSPVVTFGRTAVIHCNDEPAIELLEVVAPD
jgi:chorismate-pyruvate lyase